MKDYKTLQKEKQTRLIGGADIFGGDAGGGLFNGRPYPFVLQDGANNLYAPIRQEAADYFAANGIAWWSGDGPNGHVLSSQIACLNHLFPIRRCHDTVLALAKRICADFADVLPIAADKEPGYIAFEVTSDADHLNERRTSRGANCTSIDALILARHADGSVWLVPIEWKYTEEYANDDKSQEESGAGQTRLDRYSGLIDASAYLRSKDEYRGSAYFFEPFYQLMRQTLWAEQMVAHKAEETIKADNFLHVHIVPRDNAALLDKTYPATGMGMEASWSALLTDPAKHKTLDPEELLAPVLADDKELAAYLKTRYWD